MLTIEPNLRLWPRLAAVEKRADSDDGNDSDFETQFSSMAHAFVRDKAPRLLDYEAGFQLLDREDDNTRAVGILGCRAGSQWLYVPVFYIDGDFKAAMIYVKKQDTFVPLKENWINYLLNLKPLGLGHGISRDTRVYGVRQPDYTRMAYPPVKWASALPAWLSDAVPGLCHAAVHTRLGDYTPALPNLIKAGGLKVARALYAYVDSYPAIGRAVDSFYGAELSEAIEHVKAAALDRRDRGLLQDRAPRYVARPVDDILAPHPLKTGSLQVELFDPAEMSQERTVAPQDPEKLLQQQVLVRDTRDKDEITKIVNVRVRRQLQTPSESGLYDVAVNPGKFTKCAIILGPHGPKGRVSWCTVVEAESPHCWLNIHPSRVWVAKKYSDQEWADWAGRFPTAGDLPESGTDPVVLLDPVHADGTLPLLVKDRIPSTDEHPAYRITSLPEASQEREVSFPNTPPTSYWSNEHMWQADLIRLSQVGQRVHLKHPGSRLMSTGGDLYIPIRFKKLSLAAYNGFGASKEPLMSPGGVVNPELELYGPLERTADPLEVQAAAGGYQLNGTPAQSEPRTIAALVIEHAFSEADAREVLKQADDRRHLREPAVKLRVLYPDYIKRADSENQSRLLGTGPLSPGFPEPVMGSGSIMSPWIPTQMPQYLYQPIPSLIPRQDAREIMRPNSPVVPDPGVASVVNQAAQLGQKEIFDAAMIGGLLKTTGDDQLVDQYLGDLMKAVDRLGRILFQLYWHKDRFEERYGKTALPELESSLRDQFEGLGDIVLFLRMKTVQSDPSMALRRNELDEAKD